MAATLVGTAGSIVLGATGATIAPAFGASENRDAGNLLICWVNGHGVATLPATPSGWSVASQKAGTSCSSTIFYKVAVGGEAAPSITGVTSIFWQGRVAEFTGLLGAAPVDKSSAGTSTTTSPNVAANSAASVANELNIMGFCAFYSVAATKTITPTFNNGTYTNINNDATSLARHYKFGYVLATTGHASADSDSMAFTTTNITGTSQVMASFLLASPATGPVAQISLAAAPNPKTRTTHSLHVRARIQTGANATVRMALYEGANNRSGDLESAVLTTSLAEYILPIPDASAANIVSYGDLELRVWGFSSNGGTPVIEVADIWLEMPNGDGVVPDVTMAPRIAPVGPAEQYV